ncbi:hypothetical protein bmyco0002_54750 [Bacillus pseudomycoides]|nr:hypothetical protein bmyco0002_54750 [Bacillus pseudomycoides]
MGILGISGSRMNVLIKTGKLEFVKKLGDVSLFLRVDIEAKKNELEALREKDQPYFKKNNLFVLE